MSDAIEVLKKDIISYEEIRKSGKKCLTTNNEECCFVHYPEIKEALLALEQKEKLKEWLDDKEAKLKDIKNKGWSLEQLAGKQILINEIRRKLEEGVSK